MTKARKFLTLALLLGSLQAGNFLYVQAANPVTPVIGGGTGASTLTGCLTGNGTSPITGTGSGCGAGGGATWQLNSLGQLEPTTTVPIYVHSFATTTIANLGAVLDASAFTGSDIYAQANSAYLYAQSHNYKNVTIKIPNGDYRNVTTPFLCGVNGFRCLLEGDPAGGTTIEYTGTGTSTRINSGIQGTGIDHTSGCGISNITLTGNSYATATSPQIGLEIGGANGSDCTVIQNVNIQHFGYGLWTSANTYHLKWDSGVIRDNGQNLHIPAASNSGEDFQFINAMIVDGANHNPFECVFFDNSATENTLFTGGMIDDCHIHIEQANNVTFIGVSHENVGSKAGGWPAYTYFTIDNNIATNVVINGDTFFNDAGVGFSPTTFISNGGSITLSGIIRAFGGQTVTNFITNTGSGRVSWQGLNNVGSVITNILSGVTPTFNGNTGTTYLASLGVGTSTQSGTGMAPSGNLAMTGVLTIGSSTPLQQYPNNLLNVSGNTNGYVGASIINGTCGTAGSADLLINNNLSTTTGGVTSYITDLGENSSCNTSGGFLGDANGSYLYSGDGSFSIESASTTNTSAYLRFGTGGVEALRITNPADGVSVGAIKIATTTAGCLNTNATGIIYAATCSTGSGTVNSGFAGAIGWYASNGTTISATGTQLTVGNILATTTANNSFAGNILAPLGLVGTPSYSFNGDANTGIYSVGADSLDFTTGGVWRMGITSAGVVGIGTTNPTEVNANSHLTITSTGSTDIVASTTDNTTLSDAIFNAYAPGSRIFIGAHGTNQIAVRSGITLGGWAELGAFNSSFGTVNGLLIDSNQNVPIAFGTSNTERMRILGSGNVGIATTTPQWILNSFSTTSPQLVLSSGAGASQWAFRTLNDGTLAIATTTVAGTATSSISALRIDANGKVIANCFSNDGSTCISSSGSGTVGTGAIGQFPYYAAAGTTLTATSTLFVSTGSLVGISTSTPWAQLSINPNNLGSVPEFAVGSTTSTHFVIDGTGNIGIGTANPTLAIDMEKNVSGVLTEYLQNLNSSTNADVQLFLGTRGTAKDITTGAAIYADRTDAASQFGSTDLIFKNSVGNALKSNMIIKDSGLVGIGQGTSTPWGFLSVNPASNGVNQFIGPEFVVGSSTATQFIVDASGRVGIGTSTPFATLSVTGNKNFFPFLISTTTTTLASSTLYAIDSSGDVHFGGGTPTLSSCGTGPQLDANSTDQAGTITPGATAAGCTVTFSTPKQSAPHCQVSQQSMSLVNALSYTETATALTITQTALTGKLDYFCPLGH